MNTRTRFFDQNVFAERFMNSIICFGHVYPCERRQYLWIRKLVYFTNNLLMFVNMRFVGHKNSADACIDAIKYVIRPHFCHENI